MKDASGSKAPWRRWSVEAGGLASLLVCLTLAAPLAATEPEPPPTPPPQETRKPTPEELALIEDTFLDRLRAQLQTSAIATSMWIDGFFGNARVDEVTRGTWGYVDVGAVWKNRDGWGVPLRFRVRLSLPKAEHKINFLLGRESRDELVRGRTPQPGLPLTSLLFEEESKLLAAVGYSPPGTLTNKVDFRLGVDFELPLNPFVQARWRHNEYLSDRTAILLREIVFFEYVERLGSTTGADLEHVLPGGNLLRFANEGTISGKRQGLEWSSAVTLYHPRGPAEVLTVSTAMGGATEGAVAVPEVGLTLERRRSVFREWLFVQGTAGYSWVKKEPGGARRGTYLIGVRVQLQFGNPS